ncbi:hypothetical protein [Marinobacter xestospongiae]|uniref:Uncharacterized protein n=1 Tax=Marinobacter xestospongiae TaxID=994319 RepID=A0ABU3W181_9GAMM|nr:hypothetical protein [Marinobacter xestospongiae]MDV2080294.1 hypothetical protein [Marinobacter xestospongiae]
MTAAAISPRLAPRDHVQHPINHETVKNSTVKSSIVKNNVVKNITIKNNRGNRLWQFHIPSS